MKATVLIAVLALLLVGTLAHAQDKTTSINFNLVLAGDLPPEQVIEMRYALPATDGGMPQLRVIQFCGGVQDPRIDEIISTEACRGSEPYAAVIEVPAGTALAFQAFTLNADDPEGSFRILVQNFAGDQPTSPADYVTYDDEATHWIWVADGLVN